MRRSRRRWRLAIWCGQHLDRALDQPGNRHRLDMDLETAGLDLRHVEDAVHHLEQVLAGGADQPGIVAMALELEAAEQLLFENVGKNR